MLIILLSWICITILAYPAGMLLHTLVKRMFRLGTINEHFAIHCISGLFVINFLSSLFCLFIPLDLTANLIFVALAAAGFLFNKKVTLSCIRSDLERLQKGHWTISLLVFLFILVASFLSYLPSSHHDDGLYYSTTIKWLQEYGTIKGLANVNPRIGYNSSWHILQAAFGFRFLHAGLFNDLNGLLFSYMLLYSAGGINNLIKGDHSVENSVRAMIMMPVLLFHFAATSDVILFNVNFLGSSSADIPTCLITWLIFLLFIRKQDGDNHRLRLGDILVVFYSTWALSIKLSSVPIIFLSVYIIIRLIMSRKFYPFLSLACLCVLFILPWLIRNIIVSGYLLFPFSAIDIFPVEWKLPISDVKWHENAVRAFAVGADLQRPFDIPFGQWFPKWFRNANFIQQVSLGLVVVATISYVGIVLRQAGLRNYQFFRTHAKEFVCVATCFAGICFWLFKAPDFRFGYGFICFYGIYFIAHTCRYFLEDYLRFLFIPIGLYMAATLVFYYKDSWMSAHILFGKPLEFRLPAKLKQVPLSDKLQMNIVPQEDSWNAPLPVANEHEYYVLYPALIGDSIKQGFKATPKAN